MRGIIIRSKSNKGNFAILQNQKETREARFLHRKQMDLTYKIRTERDKLTGHLSLFIFGRSRYITPELTRPIALDMMKANGATEGKDYEIEEAEE